MAESFLVIVDDFSWPDVEAGVKDGFQSVVSSYTFKRAEWKSCGRGVEGDGQGYWNGLWLGVFSPNESNRNRYP